MKRTGAFLILAGAVAGGAGCHHRIVASAPRSAGTGSYRFIDPPPVPANRAAAGESEDHPAVQYIVPRPAGPLGDPVYPTAALAVRAPRATVALRFTVDATGRVKDVRTSPVVFAAPSRVGAEFIAAAEEAVRRWRFTPAERVRVEWKQDEAGSYPEVIGREKIEWDFDVEFGFEESGGVSAARPR